MVLALAAGAVAMPSAVRAQVHGARIQKSCTSIKRCAGTCTTSSGTACVTDLDCPPDACVGGSCIASGASCTMNSDCHECPLGGMCASAADCTGVVLPPGSAGFCVGGPDAGSRCSTVTAPCRAATGCSTCIPVQEVAVGDTFSCELLVTNVDTATTPLPAPHAQAIGQLTDEIHRTPSTCPSSSMATATGCLFDVFSSGMVFGQCIGGSEPQKRCQSGMECPGGICSLTRHCVDPATNADGGACPPLVQLGKPCMIGGSAICSAILGHADPLPDSFFVALHTDVAQRTDPNPLLDTARTKGEDLGQFAPSDFTLDFPGFINVLFPPQLVGCRITGGGVLPDGTTDPTTMATMKLASFGGQVGAPCGCVGCFPDFTHIQGNWTHMRKNKQGSFKATDFNSLVCGCTDPNVPPGETCPPAEHPLTPADTICVTGRGEFNASGPTSKGVTVAFRLDAMDMGEPGANDVYELRIWIPGSGETADALAMAACCKNKTLTPSIIRAPNIDDNGTLLSGNIQIHRELAKSVAGPCPPPRQSCP